MKSALFVDFDNVFSQLRQLKPDAAERFARAPSEWIDWLTTALPLPDPHDDDARRRRLLVRRCYLNPNWYQTYRHAFLRAGFEIVDCPPVTSQGKTSTDIHMVLDIVELLQHETRYDEFIVFSADADFTPVLRKLRRYDRRTTVLAIGFPSAAYQASADLMIDERVFVQEALGFGRGAKEAPEALAPGVEPAESRPPPGTSAIPQTPAATPPPAARVASEDILSAVALRIWAAAEESTQPVSAALLASRLRQEYPDIMDTWNGCGTFKQFYRSLGMTRLIWLSGSGGKVLDPARHELEAGAVFDPESSWVGAEAMFRVVKEVCSLTSAPMFAPRELHTLLALMAAELRDHAFELGPSARRVCEEALRVHGLRVRLRDVSFLLRGMQLNGHVFGQGQDDRATLASRLVAQVLFLCQREQMLLDEDGVASIRRWIGGEELDAAGFRDDGAVTARWQEP